MSSHSTPAPPGPSKRAIPRLLPQHQPALRHTAKSRQRVVCACLTCRTRKVKCDGGQPSCKGCREQGIKCVYLLTRKDKLRDATRYNQRMVDMLKELRSYVRDDKQQEIDFLLNEVETATSDPPALVESPSRLTRAPSSAGTATEDNDDAEMDSDEGFDLLDSGYYDSEDPAAIGFVGKSSDIHLMRRLHHHADRARSDSQSAPSINAGDALSRKTSDESVPHDGTSQYDFYLDDESVELDAYADPLQLPPFDEAESLMACYMNTVQNTFPILDKSKFKADFYHFYDSVGSPAPVVLPEKTQATWNLVFAIGAIYSHLTSSEWSAPGNPRSFLTAGCKWLTSAARDHVIYHTRACTLMQRGRWWFAHPDLDQVHLIGLFSLYYLAIGRVNRSWLASGMALRSSYALGLHLVNSDTAVPSVQKEIKTRTWWALYSLETELSTITGRPTPALENYSSVPLPLPLAVEDLEEAIVSSQHAFHRSRRGSAAASAVAPGSETSTQLYEPSNCGSYLKSTARIRIINSTALNQLYCANAGDRPWTSVQRQITELLDRLEGWVTTLPIGLNFSTPNPGAKFILERSSLGLHYHSTLILVSRPCLCRLDPQNISWNQVQDSFKKKTAQVCIRAAIAIADTLPDVTGQDAVQAWWVLPWWSMVHFVMQATATLLLGLHYGIRDILFARDDTLVSLKKLVRWLRITGRKNASAKRAYTIAFTVLQTLFSSTDGDISDLRNEDALLYGPQPPAQQGGPDVLQTMQTDEVPPPGPYSQEELSADSDFLGWMPHPTDQGFPAFVPQTIPTNSFPQLFVAPADPQSSSPAGVAGMYTTDYIGTTTSFHVPGDRLR